jgi:hypothetical protein
MAATKADGDTPMTSKKFIAYMIAELTWKAIVVLLIVSKDKLGDNLILLTIVLIAGFIEVAYILGQAYVDRYMKIADNAFDKLKDTVDAVIPDKTPDPKKEEVAP